jgi:hypothetical protein
VKPSGELVLREAVAHVTMGGAFAAEDRYLVASHGPHRTSER